MVSSVVLFSEAFVFHAVFYTLFLFFFATAPLSPLTRLKRLPDQSFSPPLSCMAYIAFQMAIFSLLISGDFFDSRNYERNSSSFSSSVVVFAATLAVACCFFLLFPSDPQISSGKTLWLYALLSLRFLLYRTVAIPFSSDL